MRLSPAARRALGGFGIVVWLVLYIGAAAAIGDRMTVAPLLAQVAFFAIAGVAWVLPLRPVFTWMRAGS
jgi:hypothetical protein